MQIRAVGRNFPKSALYSESDRSAIWGPDQVVCWMGQRDEFVRLRSIAIRKE
jgi:hypothetical protein